MPQEALKPSGYWCTLCGKKFTRKEHLERHIPHHTGIKPWGCDHCLMTFGRQDLLRRHQTIYHSISDGLDPVPVKVGSHKPDVACKACHRAKCQCDKRKPSCGSCLKKGIQCVPRENKRTAKAQARANRSAATQPPALPAQLPLPAPSPPAPVECSHQEPAMKASLEEMLVMARCSPEATGSQNSFMSGSAMTGNMAAGGSFTMHDLAFTNPTYEVFEGFGNPIQSFNPKGAVLGSQSQTSTTMIDVSPNSPFGTDFEGYSGITDWSEFSISDGTVPDYGGFAGYGSFATNDITHHPLAGNQQAFKHIGQNDGSVSAQHRSQMSQPLLSNAVHQQVCPHFEPNNGMIISSPHTPHQGFASMSSYGLPSPAKTTPSPPASGSCAQFEGDEPVVMNAASQPTFYKDWRRMVGDIPIETLADYLSAHKEELKERGIL